MAWAVTRFWVWHLLGGLGGSADRGAACRGQVTRCSSAYTHCLSEIATTRLNCQCMSQIGSHKHLETAREALQGLLCVIQPDVSSISKHVSSHNSDLGEKPLVHQLLYMTCLPHVFQVMAECSDVVGIWHNFLTCMAGSKAKARQCKRSGKGCQNNSRSCIVGFQRAKHAQHVAKPGLP